MSPSERHSLFSNFEEAAAVLREALENGHLSSNDPETSTALDNFFSELDQVELAASDKPIIPPRIVAIEALDGTGKTALTRSLCGPHSGVMYVAKRTPPDSIRTVRSLFDALDDERIARAFYMVGNYFLQHELRLAVQNGPAPTVFIVDRFYASTCAYTLAWDFASTDSLPQQLFSWPSDLDKPALTMILSAPEHVRKQRVAARSLTASRTNNPWDDRLSSDPFLAERITEALKRVSSVSKVEILNANQPQDAMRCEAFSYMDKHILSVIGDRAAAATAPDMGMMRLQSKPVRRRRVTVSVTGTHCAGKASIGRSVAKKLGAGWSFDEELGDKLRERDRLIAGGHHTGDATGKAEGKSWDNLVFRSERERDAKSWKKEGVGRVVETWHVGNAAWAVFRGGGDVNNGFVEAARDAIRQEAERACVIFVHLSIDRATSVRRHAIPANEQRLPISTGTVEEECGKLHDMLEVWTLEELRLHESNGGESIHLLVVANSVDGEAAMEEVVDKVVYFVTDKKASWT